MNQLRDVLAPDARRNLYIVYAVIGLALGSFQVGFSAADAAQPVWLTVSMAVYAYIGVMTGLTAAANTPKPDGTYPLLVDTEPATVIVEEPSVTPLPGDSPATDPDTHWYPPQSP